MPFKHYFLFLLITFNFYVVIHAQQNVSFTSITTRDGLSSNNVNAVLKDHIGLMWFATDDGLNKFDGAHFSVYRHIPNDSTSLPANEALTLHEDKSGNLWVGTGGGGVSLYDRKKDAFIHFSINHKSRKLRNNVIRTICSDHKGRIWVGHYAGIDIIDPQTRTVATFDNDNQIFLNEACTYLFEDSKQNMWMGTSKGLFCYNLNSRKIKKLTYISRNAYAINSSLVNVIIEDQHKTIWVGSSNGLSMLQYDNEAMVDYPLKAYNAGDSASNPVTTLTLGEGKQLWIGTSNGLYILDVGTKNLTLLQSDLRDVHSLSANNIVSTYFDKQGIYWVGTYRRGINKFDKNLALFPLIQGNPFDQQGLDASTVTAFAEDNRQQIYIGTEGGGLSLFNPQTRTFQHYHIRSKIKSSNEKITVFALKMTKNNKLLIGTYADGLFELDITTGRYEQLLQGNSITDLNANDVFSITEDHLGNKWVGTNGSGINVLDKQNKVLFRFTPNPKLKNDIQLPFNGYIRDLLEDKSGHMWIGTHGGGLAAYNSASKQFSIYNTTNSNLPSNGIQSILQDSRGNIWIGTYGGGLCLLDKTAHRFIIFSEKEGLQNNNVRKVVEDKNGKIWVSSDKGIDCFDPVTKKFSNYNVHNGLQHNSFIHGAGLCTRDGQLFFGGMDGFNYFNPSYVTKNKNLPAILITDLKVANQSVSPTEDGPLRENITIANEIHLDYKQNFSLSFVGLNYTAPKQNQYAYKLEGFEKNWNYVGNNNTASYTNLDPGEYVFKVIASNNDGVWNKEAKSIKIFVHPPFWRTSLAYFVYILAFGCLLLYIRYRGIKKLKHQFAVEQLKERTEQERKEAERVHELDQQKIKFLTNLSHEFRTPISLIVGPAETLLSQENSDRQKAQLQLIKRNGKRLLNLVNQLLDFRKMEEHELSLQVSEGEFVTFVKEVTDSFKDLSEKKKIDFVFESKIKEFYTRFDHDKVERILFNLLSNAFKFTLHGGTVSLLIEEATNQPDEEIQWICLKVSDTGIGIPETQQQKIFERFFQHTTAGSVLNQGTGIGLSITKEFVEMQGGTIEVQSEPEKGTTFIIQLPFVALPTPAAIEPDPVLQEEDTEMPEDVETAEPAGQNVKEKSKTSLSSILLVEDNEDLRYYLKDNLQQQYKVFEAGNGKEGWQKALAQHPTLIVSDVSMPYMDGIELCKKIKADKRTSHIPVILLTALTAEQDQLRGLEIGANDYITKPFNFDVLNAKVKNLLNLNSTLKTTYTKQIKVLTPEVEIASADEKLMGTIMHFIEENLTDSQLSVEELSRHVGMSRSSLYNKLLELTGQTPVEFIRSVKLEKAAVLLEKSDMTISEIAYSVGFSTPNYFTKSFKTKYNMLPSEYIQKKKRDQEKNGSQE